MNTNDAYLVHTDYDEILRQVRELEGADEHFRKTARAIVEALRDISLRLKPTMTKQSSELDEKELWTNYQRLQEERLLILDLSHEWDRCEETTKRLNRELDFQVRDAINELVEHVTVLAETHKAHIDILEIQGSRRLSLMTLVVSAVISYLAVWEFLAREFILSLVFPKGLSPGLNYLLLLLSLAPVFVAVFWAWRQRVTK
jgi:predicted  nucleic acid-binding Zn-ribbon protein